MSDQLVVDVEVDVEQVPDDDHGPELQRPWNAVSALGFSAPVCRRRRRGHCRRRPRPRREQGRRERPQAPANAERERRRAGAGDRPAAAMRRRGGGR